jgi:hypothetical protein
MRRIRADRSAQVKHDRFTSQGRPQCRDCRPLDAREHLELEFGHCHQRAGIARRHHRIGFLLLDRVDRKPHRRPAAAGAQSLARLVLHAHGDIGMDEFRYSGEGRILGKKRRDLIGVAKKQKLAVGAARQRKVGAGNDHGWTMVSPHRIERNANRLRHLLTAILDRDPTCRARIADPFFPPAHDPFRKGSSSFRNHAPGPKRGGAERGGRIAVRHLETTAITRHRGLS